MYLKTVVAQIHYDSDKEQHLAAFFGHGSQVWLSLVSGGCLCCHKMAPAFCSQRCVFAINADGSVVLLGCKFGCVIK